jgi:hypothetical protein
LEEEAKPQVHAESTKYLIILSAASVHQGQLNSKNAKRGVATGVNKSLFQALRKVSNG